MTIRGPRTVALELRRQTNPKVINSTPTQFTVQARASPPAWVMATGADGIEETTLSLAEGAAAKSASTSTGGGMGWSGVS